jgi:hypothetical protein
MEKRMDQEIEERFTGLPTWRKVYFTIKYVYMGRASYFIVPVLGGILGGLVFHGSTEKDLLSICAGVLVFVLCVENKILYNILTTKKPDSIRDRH